MVLKIFFLLVLYVIVSQKRKVYQEVINSRVEVLELLFLKLFPYMECKHSTQCVNTLHGV